MTSTATDIDRKLCVTAALVGAMTRKELAAAFHRVNPRTSFDVERAHKWLQGRAKPRERAIYEDWALVLGGAASADWIADCPLAEFIDAISGEEAVDRGALLRRAEAFAGDGWRIGPGGAVAGASADLIGTYACYSHAWSPYFSDRVIRGTLVIAGSAGGLSAAYTEALPHGLMRAVGRPRESRVSLHLELVSDTEGIAFPMSLFRATPPVRVLGGLMSGVSVLSSEPQPCVTRIALFRLRGEAVGGEPVSPGAYLEPHASIARDMLALGAPVGDLDTADRLIRAFLGSRSIAESDRAPIIAYHDLVAFFDGEWARRAEQAG